MKTLVELFDKEPLENVYAAVALRPERVIFAGDARLMTEARQAEIRLFFERQGLTNDLRFYPVRTDDIRQIEAVLDRIVSENEDCACDVTGGTDLFLVSVGTLCERKQIPVLFFNIRTGQFVDVCRCGKLSKRAEPPVIKTENLLVLAGGSYLRHGHYDPLLEEPDIREQIEAVWELIRSDLGTWNKQAAFFQQAARADLDFETVELAIHAAVHIHINFKTIVHCQPRFMLKLAEIGVIENYRMENGRVHYSYKNELFKRLLSDAGIWLELYTYYTAQRLRFFDDVQTSVIIDWDAREKSGGINTINEIDGILVKGVVPLFISCKIGPPSVLAINEIDTLARRFGGALARPVLVTASSLADASPATDQRARDMGVTVLEVGKLPRKAFGDALVRLADASQDSIRPR